MDEHIIDLILYISISKYFDGRRKMFSSNGIRESSSRGKAR
ncbi:hypothetical protein ACSU1N_03725 [Thermogladius sp. 4427co]